jgi:3-hydroxybutyryl-CoA dehydratase
MAPQPQLFFEDIAVGTRFSAKPHRLSTEDFNAFAQLTGDAHPIHYDAVFAATTIFKRPVAHGLLLTGFMALGATDFSERVRESMVAFAGQQTKFLKPAFVDDVIVPEHQVAEKTDMSGKPHGKIRNTIRLMRGSDILLEGHQEYFIRKREPG